MQIEKLQVSNPGCPLLQAELKQSSAILFRPDIQVQVFPAETGGPFYSCKLTAADFAVAWLPRGTYRVACELKDLQAPAGTYRLRLLASAESGGERIILSDAMVNFELAESLAAGGLTRPSWSLVSAAGTPPVESLAWNRGHEDWFYRHFDHAALVASELLLKDHDLLRGKVLDVGCGDGITDLGIFLRKQPEELVGIDPFRGFDRLPAVVRDNHLPEDLLSDPRLQFRAEDGNAIPYPDNYFDVVLSWGSLEHITGGYAQTLAEIRRVLKKDGLFFVHPGLFYGALGNHLGEFFDDPFIHLKLPESELREAVLNTRPELIDRAGHDADAAQYWQWYKELNPIRVGDFERELRALGFEPWRVAIRSSDVVEYTSELQEYAMQDLATAELYMSAWNRKTQERVRR